MRGISKVALACAVVIGVLCVGALALAEEKDVGRRGQRAGQGRVAGRKGAGMMARRGARGGLGPKLAVLRRLDLTEEQLEELKEIRLSHKEEAADVAKKMADANRALRDSVKAGDETEIRGAAVELGKVIGERAILTSKILGASRDVLTPEQVEKLEAIEEAGKIMREARRESAQVLKEARGDTEQTE